MENKLTIKDLIQAEGMYENCIASSNKLIAFIMVEAINLDLEDDYMVKNILSGFSSKMLSILRFSSNILSLSAIFLQPKSVSIPPSIVPSLFFARMFAAEARITKTVCFLSFSCQLPSLMTFLIFSPKDLRQINPC